MPTVEIDSRGCRGCTLCVDCCPGDVFDLEQDGVKATVSRQADCVGCFSCYYLCPSQCISLGDIELQRPFYRIEQNVAFVERFLQKPGASRQLSSEDWHEAYKDVSMTLVSLSKAISEMLGRGTAVLGRKSGALAAAHIPELYDEKDPEGVLKLLQDRFRSAFDFEYRLEGDEIHLTFKPCSLHGIADNTGETPGEAAMCKIFHDYLAGLIGEFSGVRYRHSMPQVGGECRMTLVPM